MKTSSNPGSRVFSLLAFGMVFVLAAFLRIWRLGDFPAGLHQDEAWFAYNAFLLLKNGTDIYGHHWPLTVNMWGEFVPAVHSYLIVPFIAIFGVHVASFRLAIVSMSLLCGATASLLMWQLFKNTRVVFITAVLFAFSPWNIVMSRASSTVIVDTFVVLCFLNLLVGCFHWASTVQKWTTQKVLLSAAWLTGIYLISAAAYFTYFTSRLLIIPMGMGVIVWAWFQLRTKIPKWFFVAALVPLAVYFIAPFGVLLRTPYALGRFQETTVLNSTTVQIRLFEDIARAGQNQWPTWLTRLIYNKATVNIQALFDQYVAFFSPSVLLIKTGPPARYFTPDGGVITLLEYFSFIAVFGGILFLPQALRRDRGTALLLLWLLALTPIPSALTLDDFPNLQRAAMVTPFWQMVAAVGIAWMIWAIAENLPLVKRWLSSQQRLAFIGIAVTILTLPSFVPFALGYVIHAKYKESIYRSRAGEVLAQWINANAHDAPLIMEHAESDFLYPYLWGQENMLTQSVTKSGPYFLTSQEVQIGNRRFVRDLCTSPQLFDPAYQYYILFTLRGPCDNANGLVEAFKAKYDDGTEGFTVYRKPTVEELAARERSIRESQPKRLTR